MTLPDLKHKYSHSIVEGVNVGPRREVTLILRLLEWSGHKGQLSEPKRIRFGGILNFEEVAAFFGQHQSFELSRLGYPSAHHSKPNSLYIEIRAERTEDTMLIHCSSVQVT